MNECSTCGKSTPWGHCIYCERNASLVQKRWDKKGMGLAKHIALWSKDPSTKVGAVIFDGYNRVLGVGYNGFPRGVPDDEELLNDREQKYPRTVHAELNAILNSGVGGRTLYCTLHPCAPCAGPIIQYGIERVVTPPIEIERWAESQLIAADMFKKRGILIVNLE